MNMPPPPTMPPAPATAQAPAQPAAPQQTEPAYQPGLMPPDVASCGQMPLPKEGVTQAIVNLLPHTVRFKGAVPEGEGISQCYNYLLWQFMQTVGGVTEETVAQMTCNWLTHMYQNGIVYEMDEETRAAGTQSPAAPTTDEPGEMLSAPVAPPPGPEKPAGSSSAGTDPVPTDKEALCAYDRIGMVQCKSLRGLKSRLTKTHQIDWKAYCEQFQLDPKTGLELSPGGQQQTVPLGSEVPTSAPPPGPGAPPLAQPPAQDPAAAPQMAPPAAQPPAQAPAPAPQAQAPAPAPQMPPPGAPAPAGPLGPIPAAPGGPAQSAPTAPAAPQDLPPPAIGYGMPAPATGAMPSGAPPQQPPVAGLPTPTPIQNAPQQPPQPAQGAPAPPQVQAPLSRAERADLLGGGINLMLVKVRDLGQVDTEGWTDANQLARVAEGQALRQMGVEFGYEAPKFKQMEQIRERIFDGMLTQYPHIMVMLNGYDWVLNNQLIEPLMSRVLTVTMIEEGGAKVNRIEIK